MTKKQMTMPGTDNELSLACDDYVEAKDIHDKKKEEMQDAKDAMNIAGQRLAELMINMDKSTIKHSGYTIRAKAATTKEAHVVAKEE